MSDLTIYEKALAAGAHEEWAREIQISADQRAVELLAENKELKATIVEMRHVISALLDFTIPTEYRVIDAANEILAKTEGIKK